MATKAPLGRRLRHIYVYTENNARISASYARRRPRKVPAEDTVALRFTRPAPDTADWTIYMRPDEALAVVASLGAAAWDALPAKYTRQRHGKAR